MCFPGAIGIMGAVVQGFGAAMSASQQAASYKAQAAIDERQAQLERERGSFEGKRLTEKGEQTVGAQVAGFAASGINPSAGTAKETIVQTGETAALDVAAVRYGARVAEENSRNKASVNRFNAQSAQSAIPFAFLSPVIGAFSSVGTPMGGMFGTA